MMTKSSYVDNLSRPRLNEDTHSRINIIMVIDIFSSINIAKYFGQQNLQSRLKKIFIKIQRRIRTVRISIVLL